MQLVGVQLDIAWEDRAANFARVAELLSRHRPAPGALVALPEMFASGFSMNVERIAESEARATETFLCGMAGEYGVYLVGGLVTIGEDGRGRNEAVVAGPDGRVAARYQKIHPFSPGREAQHYAGGESIATFDWGAAIVSPFVCYDLRFPEVFRAAAQRGASVMVVIANWPSARAEHWVTLLRARAIENQAYVLGVNRCGRDPFLAYPGRSLIADYRGEILADAGANEGVISADVDLAGQAKYRDELPFLGDAKRDLSGLWGPSGEARNPEPGNPK
ncbi:MAG TPA: nitrilase-related carbon-nitrogen hydrolase [Tepidisphaeraceae bacterium]|nr:nitrilase-related carbon-nitrogen hydrolase [Tepidisphaeraceae bacterium]